MVDTSRDDLNTPQDKQSWESRQDMAVLGDALRLLVVARISLPEACMSTEGLLGACRLIERARERLTP